MGTPEFPDLGKHCSVEDCQLVDFLPFKCDECDKVFCLEHRSYGSHRCPKAKASDATVIVCPMCSKSVRLIVDEDPNITWERHTSVNCDPSNYARVKNKRRCPVTGCKEVLTFSNVVRCKSCGKETCLKHRFGSDHACPVSKAPAAKKVAPSAWAFTGQPAATSSYMSSFLQSVKEKASSFVGMPIAQSSSRNGPNGQPANGSRRGQSSANKSTAGTHQSGHRRLAGPPTDPSGSEVCPQCGARFTRVDQLILHVDNVHLGGDSPGPRRV